MTEKVAPMNETPTADRLTALIEKWRAESGSWEPGIGSGLEMCADELETALREARAPRPQPAGLFLTNAHIEQIMNALEGWECIDPAEDEARRQAAFELIQELSEPPAAAPLGGLPAGKRCQGCFNGDLGCELSHGHEGPHRFALVADKEHP